MKLLFKQRFFSWLDSYDIYDEAGNVVYTVKGVLSWGHCLQIFDPAGNYLGCVKEEVFTFLPRFRFYLGEQCLGEIKKEFTFLVPRFTLDYCGWEVEGDLFEWDYSVMEGGFCVMQASKRLFNFTDTYELDIARPQDALVSLMIVLAIDAAKCSDGN